MRTGSSFSMIAATLVVLLFAGAAQAQATRTWVSSLGNDGNPCTRALPCQSFAGAYSQTAAGGEIDVLDAGEYGNLLIQHAITVANDGVGTVAITYYTSSDAFFIFAGSTDAVILRGLDINGEGNGAGVDFLSGGSLLVDHCKINGFLRPAGIYFRPGTVSKLWVTDSALWANGSNPAGNILVQPVPSGSATVQLERVRILDAIGNGIRADGTIVGAGATNVELHDVTVDGSSSSGIVAASAASGGPAVNIMLDDVTVLNNQGYGIRAVGATATIRLSRSTVINNTVGLGTSSGGTLASYSDNFFSGNTDGDGAPTGTIAPK